MQDRVVKSILLITHFLPPSHTAGTEQYTLALGKTMQARGANVTIICAEDWDTGEKYWNGVTEEIFEGVSVIRIHLNWQKARRTNRKLYDSRIVERWLNKYLANHNFDIVHVTSVYSLGVGILRSVKRANIPLVLTLMDFWFLCPSLQLLRSDGELCDGDTTPWQCEACLMAESRIYQRMKKISFPDPLRSQFLDTISHVNLLTRQRGLRGLLLDMHHRKKVMQETFVLPDVVIAPSETVRNLFAKNMGRQVELVRYHHDLSWVNEYRGKTASDVIRIGYIGQIHKIKGVHLLVEAFIKAEIEAYARLEIWGDYSKNLPYEQVLLGIAGDRQSIKLQGGYKREHLSKILAGIDVLVVPSIWYENDPLVIQEAFAAKTPVITTKLGGMEEAVTHEVNGLLFERNNTADLARQLQRIVYEQDLLAQLAIAIPRVRNFQDETIDLEVIYDRLIVEKRLTLSGSRAGP